jgi:hypothetical protein
MQVLVLAGTNKLKALINYHANVDDNTTPNQLIDTRTLILTHVDGAARISSVHGTPCEAASLRSTPAAD